MWGGENDPCQTSGDLAISHQTLLMFGHVCRHGMLPKTKPLETAEGGHGRGRSSFNNYE